MIGGSVADVDDEDASRGRDERDFAQGGGEGGEEFLGELWGLRLGIVCPGSGGAEY